MPGLKAIRVANIAWKGRILRVGSRPMDQSAIQGIRHHLRQKSLNRVGVAQHLRMRGGQTALQGGQTAPQAMRAAANSTLQRGYTHFRFADASLQQGSVVTGTIGSGNTNFMRTSNTSVTGNYGRGFMNANATSFGSGTANTFGSTNVVRVPTASATLTVYMFHANEPGAQGAFEAAQILKQYSWQVAASRANGNYCTGLSLGLLQVKLIIPRGEAGLLRAWQSNYIDMWPTTLSWLSRTS